MTTTKQNKEIRGQNHKKEAQNGYWFGATPKRIVTSDSASITARVNEARRFFK
jgi:hypothetical protein